MLAPRYLYQKTLWAEKPLCIPMYVISWLRAHKVGNSDKCSYNSCKWPYKWVTGVITTLLTTLLTDRPFTKCSYRSYKYTYNRVTGPTLHLCHGFFLMPPQTSFSKRCPKSQYQVEDPWDKNSNSSVGKLFPRNLP